MPSRHKNSPNWREPNTGETGAMRSQRPAASRPSRAARRFEGSRGRPAGAHGDRDNTKDPETIKGNITALKPHAKAKVDSQKPKKQARAQKKVGVRTRPSGGVQGKGGKGASFAAVPQGILGAGGTFGVIFALRGFGVPLSVQTALLVWGSVVAVIATLIYCILTTRGPSPDEAHPTPSS